MKKITKFLLCLMLCVMGTVLFACDPRTPEEKAFTYPTSTDAVIGNDGLAVQKGDYIYFVNGYQDSSDMVKKDDNYKLGALLLTKLKNGDVVVDENDMIEDDYYITMSSKLCGFEATSLKIIGDYLYFTSPCQLDANEEWAKDRVDFYRIKLDKTSSVEKIYQSSVNNDKIEFEYYENNGNVYLLVYEKEASLDRVDDEEAKLYNVLVRVVVGGSTDVVAEDVNSVVLDANYDEIYLTVNKDGNMDTTGEESDFKVHKYNVTGLELGDDLVTYDDTAEIKFVGEDYVYMKHDNAMYRADKDATNFEFVRMFGNYDSYTEIKMIPDSDILVCVTENVIEFYENGVLDLNAITDVDTDKITIIGFTNGSVVYYDKEYKVKVVSYANRANNNNPIKTIVTLDEESLKTVDLDVDYMYFYKKVNENKYLHRVAIINNFGETESLFGVLIEEDIPQEETETE